MFFCPFGWLREMMGRATSALIEDNAGESGSAHCFGEQYRL